MNVRETVSLKRCGDGRAMASRRVAVATPGTDHSTRSLFDQLGGAPAVERVVNRLADKLLNDGRLALQFDGVDPERFKSAQIRFFTEAFGGVRDSAPRELSTVSVSGEQLVLVVLLLIDTLASLGLSQTFVDQLLLAVMTRALAGDEPLTINAFAKVPQASER